MRRTTSKSKGWTPAGFTALMLTVLAVGCYLGVGANLLLTEPQTVKADKPERTFNIVTVAEAAERTYTDEELEMLALVIYQEAGGDECTDETRRMVGEVVLNRTASPRFPNTIEDVLTQRAQYGRLYWTGLRWPERAIEPTERDAVQRAYECARQVLTGPRILPTDVVYQAEFPQGTELVAHQDGFYFCR